MHVKDIMTRDLILVDKDQNIQDAIKLMEKHDISRLPVINTNQDHETKLVGILTDKDLALRLGSSKYGNLAPSHFHISTVMTPNPITVENNQIIGKVAQIMIEERIGGIPVMEGEELTGIVTKSDFLVNCRGRVFQEITVAERMSTDVQTVNPQDRLVHARRLIFDEHIGRVPVIEDGELEGMVTAKDIARSMISFRKVVPDKYKQARIRNLLVQDVMTQNVKTINPEASIEDATLLMLENNFSGIPVQEDNNLIGIITKTDVIKLIVELEEVY